MEKDKGAGLASFDAARYHRDTVRPLRATPRRLPQDLRVRYHIHGTPDDQALARHLDEVIGCWSERSREQPDYSRAVYVSLLKAHQDLLNNPAIRLHSAAWWAAYQAPLPDAEPEPANPPLYDVVPSPAAPSPVAASLGQDLGRPLDKPSSDVPPERAVNSSSDQVRGLRALRVGDDVELSWIWPGWATEALVSWDGGRIRSTVDREKYRPTGCWRVPLSPALSDGEVVFSVAVRGAATDRREWSEAVSVMAPGPRQEVTYKVRRLWYRFPSRAYTVAFRADRPPVRCDIMIGFSDTDAFPETAEACKEIDMAFLAYDMSTRLVTLPRSLGSGWLRCFLVTGESITLKDPDISTLRIRSWIR